MERASTPRRLLRDLHLPLHSNIHARQRDEPEAAQERTDDDHVVRAERQHPPLFRGLLRRQLRDAGQLADVDRADVRQIDG